MCCVHSVLVILWLWSCSRRILNLVNSGPSKCKRHGQLGHQCHRLCCAVTTSQRITLTQGLRWKTCLDSSFNTDEYWSLDRIQPFLARSWSQMVMSSVKKWQLARNCCKTSSCESWLKKGQGYVILCLFTGKILHIYSWIILILFLLWSYFILLIDLLDLLYGEMILLWELLFFLSITLFAWRYRPKLAL